VTASPIRCLRERVVYENGFARVYDDEVTFPGGRKGRHLRVELTGDGTGVVILPLHGGSVALVRTYRYPVGSWQWALPRGFSQGADPLETARGELHEELGVAEARVRLLGHVTPDSGLLANRVAVVLAEVGEPQAGRTDEREVAGVRWMPPDDLDAQVAAGEIEDGFTLAAVFLARALGELA